jgi:UDP-N-acetylglucosamine 2-epimerase (non-hydrolysing)
VEALITVSRKLMPVVGARPNFMKVAPVIEALKPRPWAAVSLVHTGQHYSREMSGIQEETTVLDIPCLTLRSNTERPVTIEQGGNVLVGTNRERIVRAGRTALRAPRTAHRRPELWDGHAAERIADVHERLLDVQDEGSTAERAEPAGRQVGWSI